MELLRSDTPHYSARAGAITVGLIALVLVMCVTHWVPLIGGDGGRLVRAEFTAANQVNKLTPVRVAGVEVGKVESVKAGSSPGTATVAMRISNADVDIKRDARAEVRWRTVLGGNMFIDLQPGSPSAPTLGDGVIPARQTANQSELDDLTQIYDGQTDELQRQMLRGLRDALATPDAIGHTLATLGPALQTVGRGLAALRGREPDDQERVVAATARTVSGLGRDSSRLQGLVDGADRTLAVTDTRSRELGELIGLGPASLDSALTTMRRLHTTLSHLDPLVARLRTAAPSIAPAANAATPALARTRTLLRDIRPLLQAAGPTLTALKGTSTNGVPLLHGLDPTVNRLNDELLPYLERRDTSPKLRNTEAIGPFFSSLDSVAAPVNDAGHLLQFAVLPGLNSVLSLNAPVAAAARGCRERVPQRARGGCTSAAQLLTRIFGGRR
jgi:virulence factor Mce-like protein